MRNSFWHKKIPTLLGLALLVVGVISTSFFAQRGTSLVSRADRSLEPRNIRVTNVSDTSAIVSFTTENVTITTLTVKEQSSQQSQSISDSRDKGSTPTERQTHHFILESLASNASYVFTILSGGETYNGDPEPYQFTTATPVTFTNTNDHKIVGKLLLASGEIAKDALIYVSSDTTQEFSALSGLDGGFSIPVQNIRNKDLSQALSLTDDTLMSLIATDGTNETTAVFRFKNANPLPTTILGNTYDFTTVAPVNSFIPKEETSITFPLDTVSSDPDDPQILSPEKNEVLKDTTPLLNGTAKPNETVTIEITGQETVQAKIISNRQGVWRYQPTKVLEDGEYTIRVSARAASNTLKTVSHTFSIKTTTEPSPTKRPN